LEMPDYNDNNSQRMISVYVADPYHSSDHNPADAHHITVPIPPNARVEDQATNATNGKGDRHSLVYNRDTGMLYELYQASRNPATGQWSAGALAGFNPSPSDSH